MVDREEILTLTVRKGRTIWSKDAARCAIESPSLRLNPYPTRQKMGQKVGRNRGWEGEGEEGAPPLLRPLEHLLLWDRCSKGRCKRGAKYTLCTFGPLCMAKRAKKCTKYTFGALCRVGTGKVSEKCTLECALLAKNAKEGTF